MRLKPPKAKTRYPAIGKLPARLLILPSAISPKRKTHFRLNSSTPSSRKQNYQASWGIVTRPAPRSSKHWAPTMSQAANRSSTLPPTACCKSQRMKRHSASKISIPSAVWCVAMSIRSRLVASSRGPLSAAKRKAFTAPATVKTSPFHHPTIQF